MDALSLRVLGPFEARLGARAFTDFRTSKAQALLVFLVTEQGPHDRQQLTELFWPGLPVRSAQVNLRQILYQLRKAIPEVATSEGSGSKGVPLLAANRIEIGLNSAASAEADVHHFLTYLEKSSSHDHPQLDACLDCQEDLEKAVALYRGDFLTDFHLDDSDAFEAWAQKWRETGRRKALDALETLTVMGMAQKDYVTARTYAERQLEVDNLREPAYRQLMEILALSGQRSQATTVYDEYEQLLAEELGMRPSARTRELYERICSGDLNLEAPLAQRVRGFQMGDEIGRGAFGTIHLAQQPSVGREVVVKVIRQQYANDPEFIRRFENEAHTVARLEHPFIVPLYDYWRDPEGAYLVMRYLRGGSLLSALKPGPWEPETAARMLDQVAGALSAAHKQGVIHRDIKPANILLDEEGNSYLSDFGIAKDLSDEAQLTATGAVVGTLDYISPEQILNDTLTGRADIYSLGAVLYETLTGEKPFADSSVANLLHKHLKEPVPLVSASRPDLAEQADIDQIDAVIQRATAKRPADRYADAMEMANAFRIAITGDGAAGVGLEVFLPGAVPAEEIYNPYKGLRAFQEADADDFHGREALVGGLISRLRQSRFLAVVGPSGSGKSSAVKAGLIPALREGAIPAQGMVAGSEKWFIAEMTPGSHPLEELELALWPVAVDPPPSLVEPMERDIRGLLRTVRRILPDEEGAQAGHGPQLLLVIDQFEELFTLVEDEERRDFFVDSLLAAVRDPRSPLQVVITLRADFYDRPLQIPGLGRLLKDNSEIVLPMMAEELTWAVREPARRMGVGLESGLAEAIVTEVSEQPGALPLLQYALTELFDARQDRQMTREAYQEIGGVTGALGRRAEEIYKSLDWPGKEAARQLFLRLVTLGEGVEDTRRRVVRSELEAISETQEVVENNESSPTDGPGAAIPTVIDLFGAARLLTFDHDPLSRESTVELAHEALLREWDRLQGWLDESRGDVRMQRMLARSAAEWVEAGRDDSYLLRGSRLEQFAGWFALSTVAVTQDEQTFLDASLAAGEARKAQEEARRQRELETARQLAETESARAEEQAQAAAGLRRRAYILGGVLLVALLLAVAAVFFAGQSNVNAQAAQENADIAATSEAAAVAEAGQRATAQAEAELQRQIADEQRDAALAAEADALAAEADALAESQIRATAEAVALDERQEALRQASVGIASQAELQRIGSRPNLAVLLGLEALENYPYTWQAERALGQAVLNHHMVAELDHASYVNHVDVSPDGTRVVTGADEGSAKVWDAATGELIHTLPGHEDWVFRVFWSPSGDRILTASVDGTTGVWDAETGEELFVLEEGGTYAFWSPDGSKIITSRGPDNTAIIWDGATGEKLFTLSGHEARTDSYDGWSPDGQRVITGSRDGTAKIWDATTGQEIMTLSGHEGTIILTNYSPDGSRIVTSSFDGTARVWNADTGEEIHTLSGHTGMPGANWSPSGDRLLTKSDNLVRVWDAESGQVILSLPGPGGYYAAWSPDGSLIAGGGNDGEIKVWDSVTGRELLDITGHDGALADLGWFPDGESIWTSGGDFAKIWKVDNKVLDAVPTDQSSGWATVPAWSPSGEEIARGYVGGVKIWDVSTQSEILTLSFEPGGEANRTGMVLFLDWSPVDDRILSGDTDGNLRVWNTTSGDELLVVPAHEDWIWAAAWSPDGQRIVSASDDGLAKVWDGESGALLLTFEGHHPVWASWSPDGDKIVTASLDGSAKVWDPDSGEVLLDLFPEDFEFGVSTAAWSPDGARIVTLSQDRLGRIWDADSGEQILTFNTVAGEAKAAWSPAGNYIVAGGLNGVRVWDGNTGNEVLSLGDGFAYPRWSPDGTLLALGDFGPLQIFPMWLSLDELIERAKACCVIGELTAEERVEFGLPAE